MGMVRKFYRQESRGNYYAESAESVGVTIEQLNAGSLQRIADACEKMCLDRESLERALKLYRNRDAEHWSKIKRLERSNAALRGHIGRLKTKLAAFETDGMVEF